MVLSLPIYPDVPQLPVEVESGRDLDHDCRRCHMHEPTGGKPVRHVCMAAEGTPGGVLFVSDYPGDVEDRKGVPMVGSAGRMLRMMVRDLWRGPVAFDNALRCRVGDRNPTPTAINKCRGYLAQTIREAKPKRIVALGKWAILSLTGHSVPVFSVRRGYSWYSETLTPVFLLMNPAAAKRNKFVREWFREDLEWALKADIKQLKRTIAWESVVRVVQTEADALEAEQEFRAAPWVSYDAETAGRLFHKGNEEEAAFRVLCFSLCASNSEDPWLWDEDALSNPKTFRVLKRIMEDAQIKIGGTNEKFDRNCMRSIGIEPRGFVMDARLVRKIQNPEASGKLEDMQFLVGMGGGKEEMARAIADVVKRCRKQPTKTDQNRYEQGKIDLIPGTDEWLRAQSPEFAASMDLVRSVRTAAERGVKPKAYAYGLVPRELLWRYNAIDSLSTARLGNHLIEQWRHEPMELRAVWDKLVRDASEAIAQIERWGVYVDQDAVEAFQTVAMVEHQEAFERIQHTMPGVDPDKPDDVAHLLFDHLRLKAPLLTKTGKRSTNKTVLEELQDRHPIVQDVIAYRKVGKNKGTYADPFMKHVRSDGRIHTSLLLDGAETGRLSSEGPNLQNIPRADSVLGKMARDCFSVPPGCVLLSVDYSQLELRVAAMESGDPVMTQIFLDGHDYHRRTAELVSHTAWGIPPEKVDSPHRSQAKAINFGTLYGMREFALAKRIGTTPEEALKVQRAIMGKFALLDAYRKEKLREARRTGYVWTTWAGQPFRRRPLWRVVDADHESRSRAENGSLNTPIQGKASDYCLFSLVECVRWILEERLPIKLVLTVHDSLLFEVPFAYVEEALYTIPRIMEQWPNDGVPILVDTEIGYSWGSLTKMEKRGGEHLCVVKKKVKGEEVKRYVPWREHLNVPKVA